LVPPQWLCFKSTMRTTCPISTFLGANPQLTLTSEYPRHSRRIGLDDTASCPINALIAEVDFSFRNVDDPEISFVSKIERRLGSAACAS
jgi:phage tail protein X